MTKTLIFRTDPVKDMIRSYNIKTIEDELKGIDKTEIINIDDYLTLLNNNKIKEEYQQLEHVIVIDNPRRYNFFLEFIHFLFYLKDIGIIVTPEPELIYIIESKMYYKYLIHNESPIKELLLPTFYVEHFEDPDVTEECYNWMKDIYKLNKEKEFIYKTDIGVTFILKKGFSGGSKGVTLLGFGLTDRTEKIDKSKIITNLTHLETHFPVILQPYNNDFHRSGHSIYNNRIEPSEFAYHGSEKELTIPKPINGIDNEYRFFFFNGGKEPYKLFTNMTKDKLTIYTFRKTKVAKFYLEMLQKIIDYVYEYLFMGKVIPMVRIDLGMKFLPGKSKITYLFLNEIEIYPGFASINITQKFKNNNIEHPNTIHDTQNNSFIQFINQLELTGKTLNFSDYILLDTKEDISRYILNRCSQYYGNNDTYVSSTFSLTGKSQSAGSYFIKKQKQSKRKISKSKRKSKRKSKQRKSSKTKIPGKVI
jgi:hypothetical protein